MIQVFHILLSSTLPFTLLPSLIFPCSLIFVVFRFVKFPSIAESLLCRISSLYKVIHITWIWFWIMTSVGSELDILYLVWSLISLSCFGSQDADWYVLHVPPLLFSASWFSMASKARILELGVEYSQGIYFPDFLTSSCHGQPALFTKEPC